MAFPGRDKPVTISTDHLEDKKKTLDDKLKKGKGSKKEG